VEEAVALAAAAAVAVAAEVDTKKTAFIIC